jgi:hypothetical protein
MSYSNSSNISTVNNRSKYMFVTYYPFILIIIGTLFNFFTFVVLSLPTFRTISRRPTIHYMRAIAIFDILMLYGWNLDHYLFGAHGFTLLLYSITSCKIVAFLNYFTPQVSAWLRVFICLDRYLSLSPPHKTWFNQSKNVLNIIACIIIVFTLINLHLLIFACFRNPNGTVNPSARFYNIYPLWDYVNLVLYNCTPFIFMVIFNSGVIYHLSRLRQTSTVQNSRIQHRSITITFVITTFLFSLMTIPATVGFAFFSNTASYIVLHLLDTILYTYHILSFPLYMITFSEFRQVFLLIILNRQYRVQLII